MTITSATHRTFLNRSVRLFVLTSLCLSLPVFPKEDETKTVRLLTVGNSFAVNAITYLPQLAEAAGHKLTIASANLGGCTLERHWRLVEIHENDPDSDAGSPYGKDKMSLADLLARDQWDFVTIQQASMLSHDRSTYYPAATRLVSYIRERAPSARVMMHQTWAYRGDDPRFTPNNEGKQPHTQQVMFEQVRAAYHRVAADLDLGLFPAGDAMYLADTDVHWGYRPDADFDFNKAVYPALPKQEHSLHQGWYWTKPDDGTRALKLDGHHASEAGKYLLGCVWFETLFGDSVVENSFVPKGIGAEYAKFLRQTAHQAIADLKTGAAAEAKK